MDHPHVCINTIKYDLREKENKLVFISHEQKEYDNSVLINEEYLMETAAQAITKQNRMPYNDMHFCKHPF